MYCYRHLTKKTERWRIYLRLRFSQLRTRSKKNRRKKLKKRFKTNVLVPKKSVWEKKRAPRSTFFRRPFFTLPFLSGPSRAGRTGSVLHRRIQISGKLLLNTANVLPSTRNAILSHLIDSPNTDEPKQIIQKDAAESENRLNTQECKNVMSNNNCFIAYFYVECTFKEIQIPSGSHVALREPVAIKSLVF